MKKTNEKFILTITGELEELLYEEAISLLPEYQKRVFFEKYSKSDTNKYTYKAITEMGEELLKEMELNNNLFLYSEITCEDKSAFYLLNASLNIFKQFCNFKCIDEFFGGEISHNSYDSIIITLKDFEYIDTFQWFKKYNLDGFTLSTVNQCKNIFN